MTQHLGGRNWSRYDEIVPAHKESGPLSTGQNSGRRVIRQGQRGFAHDHRGTGQRTLCVMTGLRGQWGVARLCRGSEALHTYTGERICGECVLYLGYGVSGVARLRYARVCRVTRAARLRWRGVWGQWGCQVKVCDGLQSYMGGQIKMSRGLGVTWVARLRCSPRIQVLMVLRFYVLEGIVVQQNYEAILLRIYRRFVLIVDLSWFRRQFVGVCRVTSSYCKLFIDT